MGNNPTPDAGVTARVRDAARALLARGMVPVPVGYRTKKPTGRGWNERTAADFDLDAAFPPGRPLNLGVLNGTPSGGLIDLDLDCVEARRAASHLLPPTGMVWGRKSAADSHYGYRVAEPPETAAENFDDPTTADPKRRHLAELRSTGGQTVVPPSAAPADPDAGKPEEPVVWLRDGEPAELTLAELRDAVSAVAAAALLARHWPSRGLRNKAALALSGGLLRAGRSVEWCERFVRAVCAAAGDEHVEDNRVPTVAFTAERLGAGDKTAVGWPTLAECFGPHGEAVVRRVCDWLGVRRRGPEVTIGPGGPAGAPRGQTAAPGRYVPIPDYVPFPVDALPNAVRDMAEGVAATMRCDPVFFVLPALAACAGMIGATRKIRLKRSWAEPACVWAVGVGESGTLKTPPYAKAVEPVLKIQAEHFKAHEAAREEYRAEKRAYDREARRAKDEDPGDPPAEPKCRRVYTRDVTVESLAKILSDSPDRLLVGRDELSGWLRSPNQYKARGGSDTANWLELHNLGTVSVDRKTGDTPTIFIQGAGVSICGGIQPGVLKAALSAEAFSAGIPARLLFALPPRRPKRWTEADTQPEVEAAYHRLIRGLAALEKGADGEGEPVPITLSMTPDAKREWVAFYDRFAKRQHAADGDTAAAFSKLEGYAARLALVHHACESVARGGDATEPVTAESVRAGVRMAEWFANEAERVYLMLGESEAEEEVRRLVEWVRRHGGRVTAKAVQRSNQRKYRTSADAEAALQSLVGLNLGRWEDVRPGPHGGRPSKRFVLEVTDDETDETTDHDDHDIDGGEGGPGGGGDETPKPSSCQPEAWSDVIGHSSQSLTADREYQQGGVPSVSSHVTTEERSDDNPPEAPTSADQHSQEVSSPPVGAVGRPRAHRRRYALITDAPGLADVVAAVRAGGPVGLDTETTGLDPRTNRVRLLQAAADGRVFLVDLFAVGADALGPLFAALSAAELVGQNLQFDLRFLARLGFVPGRVFDTMLASQVLHAGHREATGANFRHGLEDVARRELGRDLDKRMQAADWSGPLTADHLTYAAADAEVLVPLARTLAEKLAAADLLATADLEMRALPGVAWAAPVAVDRAAWLALADSAEADRDRLRAEMDALVPNPACLPGAEARNWDSPAEIKAAFAAVGVTVADTADGTLSGVAHPLAALLRDYRSAAKRVGTYGRGWFDAHAPAGAVAARWRQLGAESGRMSCADPNLQQVPRGADYRRCFVARPGHVLVKADYSQIELRIAAKVAGEGRMIAAYREGQDLHTLTAAAVLGKPAADVGKADRQLAKAVNFGLLYGMGWRALKGYARANYGVELTDAQAREYRAAFFHAYPALRGWHDRVERTVKKLFRADPAGTHEVRTLGGRRRVLPVAKKRAGGDPYPNVTDALNTPVQGTGADGLKAAVARLWERRADCPAAVPVLFCHDEVVVEAPADTADAAAAWLRAVMAEAMAPLVAPVPVEVEVSVGPTWGG